MTFKTIDVEKICKSLNYSNWVEIKKIINELSGFCESDENEKMLFMQLYPSAKVKFSVLNLQKAVKFTKKTRKNTDLSEIFFKEILFQRTCICFVSLDDERIGLACIYAYFDCPNCKKMYKVHLQPTRGLTKDCSICRKCQKKYLHKCADYRKTYEDSMIKKYGVARPLQVKKIMQNYENTMLARYGVKFSVLNQSSIDKRDATMIKKYGTKVKWRSDKEQTPGVSNAEKRFIDEIETIFSDFTIYNWKNKQKYFNRRHKNSYGYIDFYVEELKLGIEFYGDVFHINPNIYDADFVNHCGKLAKDVWEYDKKRSEDAVFSLGCEIIVVWENDWNKKKKEVLNTILRIKNERCDYIKFQK